VYGVVIRTRRSRPYNVGRYAVAERSDWDDKELAHPVEDILRYGEPDWTTCDWHGVWVTDRRSNGSYGKIAYRYFERDDEDEEHYGPQFWVRWFSNPPDIKRGSASLVRAEHLKLLAVTPQPWFQ
jgi:hypothetical protein